MWSIRRMSGQVGRAGCGTASSAGCRAASTALVALGHRTAARMARVATRRCDGEFGPGETAVVEEGEDDQPGGVDVDLLAGPQGCGGGEGPPLEPRGGLSDGVGGQLAGLGERGDEPVQRGLGRRGHSSGAVPVLKAWLIRGNRLLMVPLERSRRQPASESVTRPLTRPEGQQVSTHLPAGRDHLTSHTPPRQHHPTRCTAGRALSPSKSGLFGRQH